MLFIFELIVAICVLILFILALILLFSKFSTIVLAEFSKETNDWSVSLDFSSNSVVCVNCEVIESKELSNISVISIPTFSNVVL